MRKRHKNKLGPALATLGCWVGATVWLGWRGLVVGVVCGMVMSIGTLINLNHGGKL